MATHEKAGLSRLAWHAPPLTPVAAKLAIAEQNEKPGWPNAWLTPPFTLVMTPTRMH